MEKIKNNTDFLKLFVRNRAAVIGLTLLIIIILLALLAPFIYPENPFKTVFREPWVPRWVPFLGLSPFWGQYGMVHLYADTGSAGGLKM